VLPTSLKEEFEQLILKGCYLSLKIMIWSLRSRDVTTDNPKPGSWDQSCWNISNGGWENKSTQALAENLRRVHGYR